jgi:hypothetical protein
VFGSSVLGVVIGLIFVYFVFSMIVSKLNEFVSAKLAWRAQGLEEWLRKTLDPPDPDDQPPVSSEKFKESSLIASITPKGSKRNLPSYISPRTFSLAVLDLLAPGDKQVTTVEQVQSAVAQLPENHPAKAPLTRLAIEAGNDLTALRAGIEGWFNDSMARVSGWYKRRVQRWLLIYGVVITLLLNVDTVLIARTLWSQDAVRAAVVAQAGQQAEAGGGAAGDDGSRAAELNDVGSRVATVDRLGLPVGWASSELGDGTRNPDPRRLPGFGWELVVKLLGLAITVGAVSLGAPFWFDLLNKISKLRSAGDRPSTTPSQPTASANQPVLVVQSAQPPG